MSTPHLTPIPDKPTHDAIVAAAHDTPTIIYLSNTALPACRLFLPKYESLALRLHEQSRSDCRKRNVKFCVLEYTPQTSMMFKFSPNQLPVVVVCCRDGEREGLWARTMMGPGIGEVEEAVEGMRVRVAGKG